MITYFFIATSSTHHAKLSMCFLYQDLVEESEDDTRFDDISDSQPPIELPAAELARSGLNFIHILPTISHSYTKANNGLLLS